MRDFDRFPNNDDNLLDGYSGGFPGWRCNAKARILDQAILVAVACLPQRTRQLHCSAKHKIVAWEPEVCELAPWPMQEPLVE
jgi:hypothetical protein